MRALLAGLFCFGGLLVCVSVIDHFFPDGFGPPWAMGMFFAFLLFLFAGIALFLFNRTGRRPSFSRKSFAEQMAELESQGLLVAENFQQPGPLKWRNSRMRECITSSNSPTMVSCT